MLGVVEEYVHAARYCTNQILIDVKQNNTSQTPVQNTPVADSKKSSRGARGGRQTSRSVSRSSAVGTDSQTSAPQVSPLAILKWSSDTDLPSGSNCRITDRAHYPESSRELHCQLASYQWTALSNDQHEYCQRLNCIGTSSCSC